MRILICCGVKMCQSIFRKESYSYINFKLFNSQLKRSFWCFQISETKGRKKEEMILSKFTNKINSRGSQSSHSPERDENTYQNKAEPTTVELNRMENTNYSLQGEVHGKKEEKIKKLKIFKVNDVICDHDLQTKANNMLKYLKKGRGVLCEVFATSNKNNFESILKKLNNTQLKVYYVQSNFGKVKSIILYKEKVDNETFVEVQNQQTDKPF